MQTTKFHIPSIMYNPLYLNIAYICVASSYNKREICVDLGRTYNRERV